MKSFAYSMLAATTLVAILPARADTLPHHKPGLWVTTMTMPGSPMPAMTSKNCTDASTEAQMMQMGQDAAKKSCSQVAIHMTGNVATTDTVCKFGQMTQTTHTVISYSGDSNYHMEVHSHSSPPLMGKADRTTLIDAKWSGACPSGMKAGDIELPNGMRMHMGPPAGK